ncbi:MAG TPA: response regulator [Polyangiaceae bacterium]|nr:response regulator [Polyangiaceae bacterium]
MHGSTILLIDDDPLVLDTARRLLESEGFNVVVYSEGFNATNFAARAMPDLVLIDVNMPFVSGDNLIGLFRRHPTLQHVPIVLFSSNEESMLRSLAASVGAIGYISKSEMAFGFVHQVRRFLAQPRASSRPPAV